MISSKVVEPHTSKQLLTYPVIMRNTTTLPGGECIVLFTERWEGVILLGDDSYIVGGVLSGLDAESENWEVFTGTVALSNDRSM